MHLPDLSMVRHRYILTYRFRKWALMVMDPPTFPPSLLLEGPWGSDYCRETELVRGSPITSHVPNTALLLPTWAPVQPHSSLHPVPSHEQPCASLMSSPSCTHSLFPSSTLLSSLVQLYVRPKAQSLASPSLHVALCLIITPEPLWTQTPTS